MLAVLGLLRPLTAPLISSDLPLAVRGLAGFGLAPGDGWIRLDVLAAELVLGVAVVVAALRSGRREQLAATR